MKHFTTGWIAWLALAVALTQAQAAGAQDSAPNTALRVYNPPNTAILQITQLGDSSDPFAFDLSSEQDLWSLEFKFARDGDTPRQTIDNRLTPSNCRFEHFSYDHSDPSVITAVWQGGSHKDLDTETFDVTIQGRAEPSSNLFEWTIKVHTATPSFVLSEVEFPRIRVVSPNAAQSLPTRSEVLTYPFAHGMVFLDPVTSLPNDDPEHALFHSLNRHPGHMSMQWIAYYDEAAALDNPPVLFFGSRDRAGYSKDYHVASLDSRSISLSLRQYPEDQLTFDNDYSAPYPAVLGLVRGDWQSAALEYRSWVLDPSDGDRPVWMEGDDGNLLAPLVLRDLPGGGNQYLSAHLRDMRLLMDVDASREPAYLPFWNQEVDDHLSHYGLNAMTSILYGWHNNAFGNSKIGDWLTVHPEFRGLYPRNSVPWAPYVNFEVYGADSVSYNNSYIPGFGGSIAPLRRHDASGAPTDDFHPIPKFRTCLAAENGSGQTFGVELMKVVSGFLQSIGASGIYLDETSIEAGARCFHPGHGHPVGGGRYSADARRAALLSMERKTRAADPNFYVTTESNSEIFLDRIPLTFSHSTADTVNSVFPGAFSAPLYAAVYHDYQLTSRLQLWSSNPAETVSTSLNRRVLAYSVYFGNVLPTASQLAPTSLRDHLANPNLDGFAQYSDLLRATLDVMRRDKVRNFLHFGRRLRDPEHTAERIPLASSGGGYWWAYAGKSPDQPVVYVSAWGDAIRPDDFGVMLTNWTSPGETITGLGSTGGDQDLWVTIDAEALDITAGRYAVYLVSSRPDTHVGDVMINPSFSVPLKVPALSSHFYRFERL